MGASGLEFHFSRHFEQQLVFRGFDADVVTIIFEQPDDRFYDSTEATTAAVKSLFHRGRIRDILLVYRLEGENSVVMITIHPLKPNQKERRIQSGRWIRG